MRTNIKNYTDRVNKVTLVVTTVCEGKDKWEIELK